MKVIFLNGCLGFFSSLVSQIKLILFPLGLGTQTNEINSLNVKTTLFSYFRHLKSTVGNERSRNDSSEVTLAFEDGDFG